MVCRRWNQVKVTICSCSCTHFCAHTQFLSSFIFHILISVEHSRKNFSCKNWSMCLSYVSLWNLEKATPVQKQPLVVLDEHAALDASCSSSCDIDAFGLWVSSSMQAGIFEKEGPKELEDAGKAGLVTIQTQFSIVLGTILVCKISSHNLSSFIGDHEFYISIYSFAVVLWLISTNLNKQKSKTGFPNWRAATDLSHGGGWVFEVAYLFLQFFPDQAEQLFFNNKWVEWSLNLWTGLIFKLQGSLHSHA